MKRKSTIRFVFGWAFLAMLLLTAVGCGVQERRIGPMTRVVTNTRMESRKAALPNWPVWVFVDGKQIGRYQTNSEGKVPFWVQPYMNTGAPVRVEFRFRQPDGQVESKFFTVDNAPQAPGTR